jgi:hypothetical protein
MLATFAHAIQHQPDDDHQRRRWEPGRDPVGESTIVDRQHREAAIRLVIGFASMCDISTVRFARASPIVLPASRAREHPSVGAALGRVVRGRRQDVMQADRLHVRGRHPDHSSGGAPAPCR